MKKILCVILSLLLLAGLATTAVSAENWGEDFHLEYHYFGTNNGYDICIIDANFQITEWEEVIGGYLFSSPNLNGGAHENQLSIYAIKDNKQIYIADAYKHGLIDIDAVAEMVDGFRYGSAIFYLVFPLGDANFNRKLEIEDVILIQKVIAKINNIPISFNLYDTNQDGEINLEDVLLVQKKIAKIIPY